MDEKSVVASLALHAVLEPIFQEVTSCEGECANATPNCAATDSVLVEELMLLFKLGCCFCLSQLESDERHIAAVQTLRTAFTKVSEGDLYKLVDGCGQL